MKWTRDKPTKDGYYWYRHLVEAPIAHLIYFESPDARCLFNGDNDWFNPPEGEYAGPIPEPEEEVVKIHVPEVRKALDSVLSQIMSDDRHVKPVKKGK